MFQTFQPDKWFWIVAGDASRAWSSAATAYVTDYDDARVTRIASEHELTDVLRGNGLRGPLVTAIDVKTEAQRRIYAVASPNAQMNMTAACAAGAMTEADRVAFSAALTWVAAMRGRCADLIANASPSYADDNAWPACPSEVVALATRY